MATGRQMCKAIVRAMELEDYEDIPTPKEIWDASPTGELHHIPPLYDWAKKVLEAHGETIS